MGKIGAILGGFVAGAILSFCIMPRPVGSIPAIDMDSDAVAEGDLERIIPAVDMDETPLDEAVEQLHRLTGVRVHFDADTKDKMSAKMPPITLHMRNVPLSAVLDEMAASWVEKPENSYCVVDGRILLGRGNDWSDCRPRRYAVKTLVASGPQGDPSKRTDFGINLTQSEHRAHALGVFLDGVAKGIGTRDGVEEDHGYYAGQFFARLDSRADQLIRRVLQPMRTVSPSSVVSEKAVKFTQQSVTFPDLDCTLDAALRKPMERVDLEAGPVSDAIDSLQRMSRVVIRQQNVPAETLRNSIHLRRVSLLEALDECLPQGTGYFSSDGVLVLSYNAPCFLRMYDVRDLVLPSEAPDRQHAMANLIRCVEESVDPGNWDTGNARIFEASGRWIVMQTWPNHAKIRIVLDSLRSKRIVFNPTSRAAAMP